MPVMEIAGTTFAMSTLTSGGSWSSFIYTAIRNTGAPCFCASDHLNNATV